MDRPIIYDEGDFSPRSRGHDDDDNNKGGGPYISPKAPGRLQFQRSHSSPIDHEDEYASNQNRGTCLLRRTQQQNEEMTSFLSMYLQ